MIANVITPSTTANWFARHPKKTVAAATIIVFLALDFFIATLMPRPDATIRIPHRHYHHDLVPNSAVEESWGERTYPVFVNSLGFKDSEIRAVPPESTTYRVVFMGDSFTEARGVTYEESFPGLVAQELAGDIEVLNAAVSSYSPKLYYLKTKYLLNEVKLEFDELHVYIDISDPQDEILYENAVGLRVYLQDRMREYLLDHSLLGRAVMRQLRPRGEFEPPEGASYPWDNFYYERARWTFLQPVYENWARRGLDLAMENMARLDDLAREHDLKLTIAVYPWPEQLRARDSNSIQVSAWRRFAEERGIEFIDHFPDFMRDPGFSASVHYIPGDIHWDPDGHRIVAQRWLHQFCARQEIPSCRRWNPTAD